MVDDDSWLRRGIKSFLGSSGGVPHFSFDDDPGSRKWNLWGYINARDGAQAVRLALESDLTGTEVFIIANADTVMSRPNADLVKEFYPNVEVRGDLGEHDTLLSIDKARRLLGYEPAYGWRAGRK